MHELAGLSTKVFIEPLYREAVDLRLPATTLAILRRCGIDTVQDLFAALQRREEIAGLGPRGWGLVTDALTSYLDRAGERDNYEGRLVPIDDGTAVRQALARITNHAEPPATEKQENPMTESNGTTLLSRASSKWSDSDERELVAAGAAAADGELISVFGRIAGERGISTAAVRNKYYSLRPGGKSKATPAKSAAPARTTTKRPSKGARWSRNLEGRLFNEATQAGRSGRSDVFAQWAARRGVSVSTIKSKYYELLRERGSSPARQSSSPSPAPAAPATEAATGPAAQATVAPPSMRLDDLTISELATLARQVNEQLERKISTAHRLWS